MEWSESISEAINYIESHITEELTIADIAKQAIISPYYFQKGFSMLCGFTVGEYIKRRRLTLAGSEIVSTDRKIIDIALEYGYDSPDSFTKAFLRFHGATPTAIRKGEAMIKSFAPLKIKLILTGGYTMDWEHSLSPRPSPMLKRQKRQKLRMSFSSTLMTWVMATWNVTARPAYKHPTSTDWQTVASALRTLTQQRRPAPPHAIHCLPENMLGADQAPTLLPEMPE